MYKAACGTAWLGCILVSWLIHGSSGRKIVSSPIGQTAHLPCTVEIAGSIHVEWMNPEGTTLSSNEEIHIQDQRFSISHPYVKEWILVISNVRTDDAGNYTCSIRVGQLDKNHIVELIVAIPPEITSPSGAGSYLLNSTVTLRCAARGTPEPKITWHQMQKHVRVALNVEGEVYVIDSLDLASAGAYECHATNGFPPIAMAALTVDVLFAPIVKVPYQEIIQELGRWSALSCLVIANPKPKIQWIQNGHRVPNSTVHLVPEEKLDRYHSISTVSLEHLNQSNYGNYECHVENTYGADKGLIRLSEPDRKNSVLVEVPRDSVATVGEDALFNCSVRYLPIGHRFTWLFQSSNETKMLFEFTGAGKSFRKAAKHKRTVLDDKKHVIIGQYSLFIQKVDFSDQGTYVCQVSGHGNHSAKLLVIASQDPSNSCEEQKGDSLNLNTTLIILGVVVVVLLIVAIIVVALVFRLVANRSRGEESNQYSVQLNSKFTRKES